jgi:cytochrome P450
MIGEDHMPANAENLSLLDSWGNPAASHVPPELIRSIEWCDSPDIRRDAIGHLTEVLRAEPPLFYNMNSPFKGQCWVVNSAALLREVVSDADRFSSENITGFAESLGENWLLGAVEMDDPQHAKIREIMLQWLNPVAISKLKDQVDSRARELVSAVADKGGCEFIDYYATNYPVGIILDMLGLPQSDMPILLEWMHMMIHGTSAEERLGGAKSSTNYFRDIVADRNANPRDDLLSRVVHSQYNGVRLPDDEIFGIVMVLFIGGLDTVASSLGQHFHHLARDQELQDRLRKNPEDIPKAIQEMLRLYPPSTVHRMAKVDTEVNGIKIRKGDWLLGIHGVVNRDPEEFSRPDVADIDRMDNRHLTFSYGPHFCIGMHLAQRELTASYREWLTRVPPFRLADPDSVEMHGGLTFGINKLELVW